MKYENNWESLNSRPVPQWFADAKFGIFIHWGIYSVPAFTKRGAYAEWYRHQIADETDSVYDVTKPFHDRVYGADTKYEDLAHAFKAELFDADHWADVIARSGAKYMNLVTKHHDGYCLYKTDYAWNWNSVDVGPHRDFCAELKAAVEPRGVKFGVYHSVYEWAHPLYLENPERYALEHLIPMLKELVVKYEPWTLFTDGEWEYPSSVWHSTDFLTWLYNESPVKDTIVPNDRWGKETRGRLGGNFTTEYGRVQGDETLDGQQERPFEECRGIGRSFGYNRIETCEDYLPARELLILLCSLVSKGGNLLLNIGPAADGTIPAIMEERLLQIGRWLKLNGEAIYATRPYAQASKPGLYYTQTDKAIYAISEVYPWGELELNEVPWHDGLRARLIGSDAPIEALQREGHVVLHIPPMNPDTIAAHELFTFRIEK